MIYRPEATNIEIRELASKALGARPGATVTDLIDRSDVHVTKNYGEFQVAVQRAHGNCYSRIICAERASRAHRAANAMNIERAITELLEDSHAAAFDL